MLANQFGKIIESERRKAGISADKLCFGLCSNPFLFRVEKGKRKCEKVLADALLQRMGVSAEKFVYIMNPEEQEWLIVREQLIQAVDEGSLEKAKPVISAYQKITAGKSKLHRQFLLLAKSVLEWKNGMDNRAIQDKLWEGFQITMPDMTWEKVEDMRLSLTELNLAVMHGRIAEAEGNLNEAGKMYALTLGNMNAYMDAQDRVKLYPQVAYRLGQMLKTVGRYEEALGYVTECIRLLKECGNITYMRQFLEEYDDLMRIRHGADMPEDIRDEISQNEQICASLKWLYEQYKVPEMPWIWNIPFSMGEVELCHDVIRRRRKVLGMSQESLSEGICDPVSLSRIECGKVKPKNSVLKKLMEKVGMAGESFVAWHQVHDPELLEVTNRIADCLSMGKFDEAEELVEMLEEKVQSDDADVRQYLQSIKTLTLLNQKKISKSEHRERQEEALYLTLPKVSLEKLEGWVFSSQEVDIINGLSYSCETPEQSKQVIKLLQIIENSYRNKKFALEYYVSGYELTARNLGHLLGNFSMFAEAIRMEDEGIRLSLSMGRAFVLWRLLYDRGWGMEQLWERGEYTPKESLNYIEASLALCMIVDSTYGKQFLEKHLQRLY